MAHLKPPIYLAIVICMAYSFCAFFVRQISVVNVYQNSPVIFRSVPVSDNANLTRKVNIPNVNSSTRRTTPDGGTTCSKRVILYGSHQKLISYSIYGVTQNYWIGLPEILVQAKILYPGWFVRVYTDFPDYEPLRVLLRNNSNLQVCDINNLPPPWVSLKEYPSMLWRYFPLGDAQVDVVIFRDSDSQLLVRDHDAVDEWLSRTFKSLHAMRDNPYHNTPLLGGMWGARITPQNRKTWKDLRDQIFERAKHSTAKRDLDQELLKSLVRPAFKGDIIGHDSYTCTLHEGSVPFPSKRYGLEFVGSQYYFNPSYGPRRQCPVECRPPEHKDWLFC